MPLRILRNHSGVLWDLAEINQESRQEQGSHHGQHGQNKAADRHGPIGQAHSDKNGCIGWEKALGNMAEV